MEHWFTKNCNKKVLAAQTSLNTNTTKNKENFVKFELYPTPITYNIFLHKLIFKKSFFKNTAQKTESL